MIDVCSFYRFTPLKPAAQEALKLSIEDLGRRFGLRGLCLLGHEGVNLTASGPRAAVDALKRTLIDALDLTRPRFNDSVAPRHPFRVLRVKVRQEIVTLGKPELCPAAPRHHHLSPAEWRAALANPDAVVLDTRNDYEVELGKFTGAVDLGLSEFREFPDKLRAAALPKDRPVLIYCTGGIRCEKAILEMTEQGFTDVHQLDGGILNYLAHHPDDRFEGECFVFDYRVAVDQRLRPTARYLLCPHCGQPANVTISCVQCPMEATLCGRCADARATCSKNCDHHRMIESGSRRPHAPELAKRRRAGAGDAV